MFDLPNVQIFIFNIFDISTALKHERKSIVHCPTWTEANLPNTVSCFYSINPRKGSFLSICENQWYLTLEGGPFFHHLYFYRTCRKNNFCAIQQRILAHLFLNFIFYLTVPRFWSGKLTHFTIKKLNFKKIVFSCNLSAANALGWFLKKKKRECNCGRRGTPHYPYRKNKFSCWPQ